MKKVANVGGGGGPRLSIKTKHEVQAANSKCVYLWEGHEKQEQTGRRCGSEVAQVDSHLLVVGGGTGTRLWGRFPTLVALAKAPQRASNKDFHELHQAWVLVEFFLQSQVLERGQLLVPVTRGRSRRW